jgi:hypothetical protein
MQEQKPTKSLSGALEIEYTIDWIVKKVRTPYSRRTSSLINKGRYFETRA